MRIIIMVNERKNHKKRSIDCCGILSSLRSWREQSQKKKVADKLTINILAVLLAALKNVTTNSILFG